MLVLTRKKLESIRIGEDIEITILAVDGDTVKVGITAPKHVAIHREEVYRAIAQENKTASTTKTNRQLLQTFFKK